MTLSFAPRSRNAQRRRKRIFPSTPDGSGPRYKLVVVILLAFLGGYVIGKRESMPSTLNNLWGRLATKDRSLDHLLGQLTKSRLGFEEKSRSEYGEYLGRLVLDPIQLQHIFVASKSTRNRLQRRLLAKLLDSMRKGTPSDFVWATAGDAAAAGHGNMYNQSYTHLLQQSLQPVFRDLGMNFVGRSYGMSWYTSAPELALCMEEIYGLDVDVLVWDFSMQDGNHYHKMELWIERALQHPALPILVVIDNRGSPRWEWLQDKLLEEKGLGVVFVDKLAIDLVRSRVPLSSGDGDLESVLPPALQHWVCEGGAVEGSLPCDDALRFHVCEQQETAKHCLAHKFKTLPGCDSSQKPFHPGWKEHLFRARLLGEFLLDMLEESLYMIEQWQRAPNLLLDHLVQQQAADLHNATMMDTPKEYEGIEVNILREWTPHALFRGPAICHTALLPAESRFLGAVTDSPQKVGTWEGGYDMGVNKILAHSKDGSMLLAYEPTDRLRCAAPKIDHKDFFIVRNSDYWVSTVVPNNAELKLYGSVVNGNNKKKQQQQPMLQGIIVVCLQICPMDRCSDDYIGFGKSTSQRGHIGVRVDNRDVTHVRPVDQNCYIMEHDHGLRWGPGRAGNGRYKLSFRLHTKQKGLDFTIRISSIIVT